MSFEELGLNDKILKAVSECGYTEPTPIQNQAIPIVLMMRDLVGIAQTGTGKTAGFTLPMIEVLSTGQAKARMPRSLVLAPTRELAAQVAENFETYGKYTGLTKALLVGGSSMGDQLKVLERGADVLIATPGRLLDLFDRGAILLNDIKIVVIDEADRMLDMGFIPDIEKIFSFLPSMRQTLLFSATMPDEVKKLSEKFLNNPKRISVAAPSSPAKTVEQFICKTAPRQKNKALKRLLEVEDVKNAFIFCNRKRDVDNLAKWLRSEGFKSEAMHGDMHQKVRYDTLDAFKEDNIRLLVCSDVAARGLDVAGLSHVFNFDVPFNAEDYVHRIGRTGRAGLKGRAFTLVTRDEEKLLTAIEKLVGAKIQEFSEEGSGSNKGQNKSKEHSNKKTGQSSKKDDQPRSSGQKEHQNRKSKNHSHRSHEKDNSRANSRDHVQDDVKGFGEDVPSFFSK